MGRRMGLLTDDLTYAGAQKDVSSDALWALFDGDRHHLNIAHECIDRHATSDRAAVLLAHADGRDETLSFREISRLSSQFAHFLKARGIKPGDRVAIMLEPSRAFYTGVFGAMKMGAVAVPLFTLFGPDGFRLRVADCNPRLLLTSTDKAAFADGFDLVVADDAFFAELAGYPDTFTPNTAADDLAILQYTSGTTREQPEAVRHTHRAIVTLMLAALYGSGLRPGDRFFCPSSPAWGHGLWHGTLAPLALGVQTGAYCGRFDAERLLKALQDYQITNLSAAATHYRMMRNSGAASRYHYALKKLSYTGEPIDSETLAFVDETFKIPVCSMYGTTEIGVILVNYPGAPDFDVKPGSLGKAIPNVRVEVQDTSGKPTPPDVIGELKVWRGGTWLPTKDLGYVDADGYFYHAGRADDVIISAGWTMSAVEIEDAILKHPDVREAAAIGVPDPVRGQIVKAFVVSPRNESEAFAREIQDQVRSRLSQHEYPRVIEFVTELPKTSAGKINRKRLRDQEAAALASVAQ
jgi:acetyl-CoA synthetase